MTWKEAWKRGAQSLQKAGVEEYDLDAWYLLEHVTGITKASYYMEPEHPMHDQEEREYLELIRKRSTRIPLQHLTGVQEFMGLEFLVNEHVLIPRQDTEVLVETALDVCRKEQMGEIRLLDMCTGSGCILLSLLHELKPRTVTGVGVDLSKEALCVAEKNAEKLKINAEFLESDLFENVKGTYDVIVSNPPYIRTSVIETLQEEVKDHDPYLALDGKEDGLYFYRRIIEQAPAYLKKKGWLLFEIGSDQEFMGLEFLVNEHVLIPRQDTEVLVETALDVCRKEQMGEIRLLDMCTGSGCILLSLLHELKPRTVTGVGVDLSKEALCVAEKNAEKLKINAEFLESDLFENVKGTYDVIVSNPPYIRTSVIETLQEEVKDHDPYLALDGKEDGLYFYRRIIQQTPAYLKKKGWLLLEIGSDQGADVKKLMEQAGYTGISVKKDLAGLDRVVFGVYDR